MIVIRPYVRSLMLIAFSASLGTAQSPRGILSRLALKREQAARAVEAAITAERDLRTLPPRAGYVAVLAQVETSGRATPLAGGVADLVATDVARVHALHPLERMRAQAIVQEVALAGVDEQSRPRSWRLLGAADVVVVSAMQNGNDVEATARVVHVATARMRAAITERGPMRDLFDVQRRLSVRVVRALGVEPTSAEIRSISDRRAGNVDAFLAWTAAMQAVDAGDASQAERLLRTALDLEPGINGAFDASLVVSAMLTGTLANVSPLPGSGSDDDPSAEGLATEGNETEFGEAWVEVPGARHELRLYEATVPLSASMALGRGRLDLSTVWASSRADTPANDVFHAWGFTDVHVRYAQPIGASGISLSVGAALPSRDAHGADDDIRRVPVSPDLLPLAMYRRRNAPAFSGGLFWATSTAKWDWGVAGGAEWNSRFDEVAPSLHTITVSPGMRWRARIDADRSVRAGRLSLGGAVTAFSAATRAGARITGGERVMVRASQSREYGSQNMEIGAWVLRTAQVRLDGAPLRAASTIVAYRARFAYTAGVWRCGWGVEMKDMWQGRGSSRTSVFEPQLLLGRSLWRTMHAELGASHLTGMLDDPLDTRSLTASGWSLRATLRYEP